MFSSTESETSSMGHHLDGFDEKDLDRMNRWLEQRPADYRVRWACENLPGTQVLSSSFGIQSAVMLHLVTSIKPDIPVVLVDTGYLFEQTYRFADELSRRLQLNLRVYRASTSSAWQEARHGKLWEQGLDGIEYYNRLNKVEPFNRALDELGAGSWFAGLRRQQSGSRQELPVLRRQNGRFKLHPIVDWSDRDIHGYLRDHDLPYHPLWQEGYVSVGDFHTSAPLGAEESEEQTRFFGLKRECGLHE